MGRATIDQFVAFMDRMAEARASVAALLVADPDDIALTHSTTDGINLVLSSLPWASGDRVVTTNHEHPGVLGPLQALRDRHGVEVDFVDIGDGGDAALTLAGIRRALERPARAVVASHVLWTTGAVLPVAALGALAREAGAVSVIDGAQSAGAIPVALDEVGVDAYAVPGQKWLLGPEGMGALWVRRAFADATIPAVAGYLAYSAFDREKGGDPPRGCASVRGDRLPPSVGHRTRAQRGLADDVRRAHMGAGTGRAPRCIGVRASRRDPGRATGHAPRPRRHARDLPHRRVEGRRRRRRSLGPASSRSSGTCLPSTQSASRSASGTRRRSWSASRRRWSSWPATRPRRSRRARPSPSWGAMTSPSPEDAAPRPAAGRRSLARPHPPRPRPPRPGAATSRFAGASSAARRAPSSGR